MKKSGFQFKQFSVYQDRCAMKVGTDGVLLGAWVDVANAKNTLDIGTGTGLIALMMAQRSVSSLITAIEIDSEAACQATENVLNSPWKDRIEVVNADLLDFNCSKRYDVIVSNPPYFSQSLPSPNKQRTLARHNDHLTYSALIQKVATLLSENGRFSVIIPYDHKDEFIQLASQSRLYLQRIVAVKTTPTSVFRRVLLEFSFVESIVEQLKVEELLIERERHQYSIEYINLTKDFYLKM
ncbi:MAG: methyltransferase [Bacteroides sp.]|nr:methyltransferase [Bacteroides sp.]